MIMGRNAGGVTQSGKAKKTTTKFQLNDVANALFNYAHEDKWNKNTEYSAGFNNAAQYVIDSVADHKWGFASEVAKTVKANNYYISEKQAQTIAATALEHNAVKDHVIFRHYDIKPKPTKILNNKPFVKSSTKIEVGANVIDPKKGAGKITHIITKSTGYVEVTYANGSKGKAMAFNLMGTDGKYLKKKQ